jgi:putative heme-binding domain-containing protein
MLGIRSSVRVVFGFTLLAAIPTFSPALAQKKEDAVQLVAPTEAIPAAEQQKMFHLPPGFEIQLVAAEPEIRKPMNLNFDFRGRLFATQSVEYPFPAKDGAPRRDTVRAFDNFAPDGRAGRVTVVVDGLNIPIGVLPLEDGVIYYSIPEIYGASDAGPDGMYRSRRVLYSRIGYRDTHGMSNNYTRWIDGWIYACHGYANDSTLQGADGNKVSMNSGNTYRLRADGSHVEQWTHGQVNPFGLCFDPLGNLYSADCHTMPLYMLLRGAWYPSFGKPHDGLGYGPEMIDHLHGSTGIAGVVYYAANQFPKEYRDTVFIGNPVTGRVNHDRLESHGSTYKALELPDFITCDDPWFRPVNLKLGPDGALYIADFYNCIIGHYEVPLTHPRRDRSRGRIWRVVYKGEGAKPLDPLPNFDSMSPAQLVDRLGHPNLQMRVLATERLATLQATDAAAAQAIDAALANAGGGQQDAFRRAHALWLVERRRGGLSDAQIERLAADPDRLVRVHLLKALAERAAWNRTKLDVAALVRGKLTDEDAFVRRAAADALGRHPDVKNVEPLLALWKSTAADDTHLIHVARMALRDQLLPPKMYSRIETLVDANRDAAARIAELSLGVRTPQSADYLLRYLANHQVSDAQLGEYVHDAARYIADDRLGEVQQYAARHVKDAPRRRRAVILALASASQERGKPLPPAMAKLGLDVAKRLLSDKDAETVGEGIELARELRMPELRTELSALAAADSKFGRLRPLAIDAILANDPAGSISLLAKIVGNPDEEMPLRRKVAETLATVSSDDSRKALAGLLRGSPMELAVAIARGLSTNHLGGELLLAEIAAGRASPELLQNVGIVGRLRELAKIEDLDARITKLTTGLVPADARLRNLIESRRRGFAAAKPDAAAGKLVFAKTCAACHKIQGEGAKIGPELDGIGLRGLDRILEDVLDPGRNVDQAFRSTSVETKAGLVEQGLVLREEGKLLILADAQGKEKRIPLDEITEREVTMLSPMPANVPDLVPEADFYNLLAFLLEQKQKKE